MSTPAQREEIARGAGFPSYEAMALFYAQRNRAREPDTIAGIAHGNAPSIIPAPLKEAAGHAMDWHPMNIFNRITEALKGATGN